MLTLDGSVSPYLPTREILDAIQASTRIEHDPASLARMLRERLALLHGVALERIALFPNDARRFEGLIERFPTTRWVFYPPVDDRAGTQASAATSIQIRRSERFRIEAQQIAKTPPDSIASVVTPNDPTGTATGPQTAVQLAQRARLLVLDDRSAELRRRSLVPLVEEFDTIVLVRSFADWAGLGDESPGYAIASPGIANAIDRSNHLDTRGLHAALAAVGNADKLDAIAHRVRLERLRLFRMLRKSNFLSPYPSDAGYVLAEITRGDRDEIVAALLDRGISAYAPRHRQLERTVRFAAISPAATRMLQTALVDISRTVLD